MSKLENTIRLFSGCDNMRVVHNGKEMDIRALCYQNESVRFIDQKILPNKFEFLYAETVEDVAVFIEDMTVRGAPSIGAAGAYGMALAEITGMNLNEAAERLKKTRPTAFDLFFAVDRMLEAANDGEDLIDAADDTPALGWLGIQ